MVFITLAYLILGGMLEQEGAGGKIKRGEGIGATAWMARHVMMIYQLPGSV